MPRRPAPSLNPTGANLKTVADKLGLAVSTVSRALRNHPSIHPGTRLKVQTEANRLGYTNKRKPAKPSASKRPPMRHVLTLALASDSGSQQAYLSGISRAASTHNIGIYSYHCPAEEADSVLDPVRMPPALHLPDLAGIILIHRWPHEVVARLSSEHACVSLVHRYPDLPLDTVGTDDEAGLRLLVSHMIDQGHHRIGFFGYDPEFTWSRSRLAAYISALIDRGIRYDFADTITVPHELALVPRVPDVSEFLPQVKSRIEAGTTAWIASSNVLGRGLLQILKNGGYDIPGKIAVAGYHAGRQKTNDSAPELTSIAMDDEALGATAVHMLDQRVNRSMPGSAVLLLPGTLVISASTRR